VPAVGAFEVGLVAIGDIQAEGVVIGVFQVDQVLLVVPGGQTDAIAQPRAVPQPGVVPLQAVEYLKAFV